MSKDQSAATALNVRAGYGLDDQWTGFFELSPSLRLGATGAWERPFSLSAQTGLTYAVDVLQLVPFVEAGLAMRVTSRREAPQGLDLAPGVSLAAGGHYFWKRRWAITARARWSRAFLRPATWMAVDVGVTYFWDP